MPVLTLTKILEDCAPPVIHFLKIDVEGGEDEEMKCWKAWSWTDCARGSSSRRRPNRFPRWILVTSGKI